MNYPMYLEHQAKEVDVKEKKDDAFWEYDEEITVRDAFGEVTIPE